MQQFSTSLLGLVTTIVHYRQLIQQIALREVLGRYRGSFLGLAWSFVTPLLMLAVYTFVFAVVFKAKWNVGTEETQVQFAVVLFAGLMIHGLFSEVINRAPGLITSNINYVKKVIFPLEILPVISLSVALFHAFISFIILFFACLVCHGTVPWTFIFTPVVVLPLVILTLGLAWFLASLGVYIRDIGQTIGIITTVMLFLSPVFFPISALPDTYHILILINPLTFIIEQLRAVMIWGDLPHWQGLGLYFTVSMLIAWLGYFWFQKTRKGFADVL